MILKSLKSGAPIWAERELTLFTMVIKGFLTLSIGVEFRPAVMFLTALLAAIVDSGSRLVVDGRTASKLLRDLLAVTVEGDSKKASMFLFFDVLAIVLEDVLASFFDGLLPFVNQLVNMLGALTLALDPRTASIASEAPEAVSSCPMSVI